MPNVITSDEEIIDYGPKSSARAAEILKNMETLSSILKFPELAYMRRKEIDNGR